MMEPEDCLKKMAETQFVVEATWDEVYMLWGGSILIGASTKLLLTLGIGRIVTPVGVLK